MGLWGDCAMSREELTDWSGDIYYQFSSDSSFMTWFSDVVWFVEMCYLALLLCKKGMSFQKDRARIYGIGFTILIGFAAFWGFVHHCFCYDNSQSCFLRSWGSVSVSCMSSGAMAILSGIYMLTGNKVYNITLVLEVCLLLSFTYIGMQNYFEMMPFIIVGLFGNVFPQIFLFICFIIQYLRNGSNGVVIESRTLVNYLAGFCVHMVGVAISIILSKPCSMGCPVDCPLPVPHLNHNGLTHITEMIGALPIAWASAEVYEALDKQQKKKI